MKRKSQAEPHDGNRVHRSDTISLHLNITVTFGNERPVMVNLPVESPLPRFAVNRIMLTPQQSQLYKNGRQQVRVAVTIEAKEGLDFVQLTEEEKASIRLFEYFSGKDIPMAGAGEMPADTPWASQLDWEGFEYFPGSTAGSVSAPCPDNGTVNAPQAGETFFRYVTAGRSAPGMLKLAFRMTARDGSIYRSNGRLTPGDGSADFYNPALDIATGTDVTPRTPLAYGDSDFVLTRQMLGPSAAGVFDDLVTLRLRGADGVFVGVRRMTCEPEGMAHWETAMPADQNPCLLGYAEPGHTAVHWHASIIDAAGPMPDLRWPEPDRGAFVLCGRVGLRREHLDGVPQDAIRVFLVDANGSDQRCTLQFENGTRDRLIAG